MRIVTVDAEGADLIEAAAEMAAAALEARSRRVDEDGVLKRSVDMSRIKTADILRQLRGPALAEWADVPEADRVDIIRTARHLIESEDEREQAVAYGNLRAYLLRTVGQGPKKVSRRARKAEDL